MSQAQMTTVRLAALWWVVALIVVAVVVTGALGELTRLIEHLESVRSADIAQGRSLSALVEDGMIASERTRFAILTLGAMCVVLLGAVAVCLRKFVLVSESAERVLQEARKALLAIDVEGVLTSLGNAKCAVAKMNESVAQASHSLREKHKALQEREALLRSAFPAPGKGNRSHLPKRRVH